MITTLAYAAATMWAIATICIGLFCRAEWLRKRNLSDLEC